MAIEVNGRRFKHFNEETLAKVQAAGPNGSPAALEKELGIDARRISDLQLWLGYRDGYRMKPEIQQLIKDNIHMTIEELGALTGVNSDKIMWFIKRNNLRPRLKSNNNKIPLDRVDEYEADLANPNLSHAWLGHKWGVRPENIGSARKRRGHGVWRTNKYTVIERITAQLLDELDFAYMQQKRIGNWSLDFYLGHQVCLDVHGAYFHSKPENQERDKRKAEELKALGYTYIVIWEHELLVPKHTKTKIAQAYWASLQSNLQQNNFVNPVAQGCPSSEGLTGNPRVGNPVPSSSQEEKV